MHITHIITRFIRGGADENTLLSCNLQAEAGNIVDIVTGAEVSQSMINRLHPGVNFYKINSMKKKINIISDFYSTIRIYLLLRHIKPDIVHTHTSKAGFVGRLAASMAGIKIIIHGIHILPFVNVGKIEEKLYLFLERLMVKNTDAFVSVSRGMLDTAIRYGVGGKEKHFVVPSGMDVNSFVNALPLEYQELKAACNAISSTGELIVMAAALESRKRVYEFLEEFSIVAAHRENAVLVVLGEGRDRERVIRRIGELGLEGRVFLLGFRNDVERWIKTADVCVLSSEREGLPRVVIQYVLCGRPVVCTCLPGVEEIVEDGVNGLLVPIDDLSNMADAIIRILTDKSLKKSMSNAAEKRDLSKWSAQFMYSELDKIYRKIQNDKR